MPQIWNRKRRFQFPGSRSLLLPFPGISTRDLEKSRDFSGSRNDFRNSRIPGSAFYFRDCWKHYHRDIKIFVSRDENNCLHLYKQTQSVVPARQSILPFLSGLVIRPSWISKSFFEIPQTFWSIFHRRVDDMKSFWE